MFILVVVIYYLIITFLFNVVYVNSTGGVSPGKRVLDLTIIDESDCCPTTSRLILREIGKNLIIINIISLILVLLGYRSLHDRIAKTRVIDLHSIAEEVNDDDEQEQY